MALGDVSISDARYLGLIKDGGTVLDISDALLSCNPRIVYELIESEYTFGEQGRRTSVSTHYTWKLDVRLRVDAPTAENAALGSVATVIAGGVKAPIGTGTGKFDVAFAENESSATAGNPVYSGEATINDIAILLSDSDMPASERILAFEMRGSGDLTRATS